MKTLKIFKKAEKLEKFGITESSKKIENSENRMSNFYVSSIEVGQKNISTKINGFSSDSEDFKRISTTPDDLPRFMHILVLLLLVMCQLINISINNQRWHG